MPQTSHPEQLVDAPMTVTVEGPAVVITGPATLIAAMTAEAAQASAERLLQAAAQARANAGEPLPILPIDQ